MKHALSYIGDVNSNRFLLLDLRNASNKLTDFDLRQLGRVTCHTNLFDDLLVFDTSSIADVRYRIFGGDTREADFCGNGALLSLSLLRRGQPHKRFTLETRVGLCRGLVKDDRSMIKMNSVEPLSFEPKSWIATYLEKHQVSILGARSAGEPHLIISAPDALKGDQFDQQLFECICGPLCESFNIQGGINLTMILNLRNHREASICTFERGARRMTLSCGSGSLAAASFLETLGPGGNEFTIKSPGGSHKIFHSQSDGSWWLSASSIQLRPIHLGRLLSNIRTKKTPLAGQNHPSMRSYVYYDEAQPSQKEILGPFRP